MATVYSKDGERVESLLKRFNRKVNDEGIMGEIHRREFYESRGQKARRERKERRESAKRKF